ncbi:MAG: ABC transporter ATP-binding protein [Candidatus Ozemobacteraceae bacterium]
MIVFDGLTRKYGSRTVVDNLNLRVPDGAVFGFIGPNGAGKTTTLRMLMGLLRPSAGRATIDGFDVSTQSLEVRARVGYLPDDVFLYDYLTGRQFLEFIADIRNISPDEAGKRIDEALERFSLVDAAGEYTANYSFGMKKKLALAGIILHKPSVLLLDEPFNGLDPQAVKDFRTLLQRMAGEGVTILFSSHVLEVVEKLVSHVGVIAGGKLCASGPLGEILAAPGESLETAFFKLIEP